MINYERLLPALKRQVSAIELDLLGQAACLRAGYERSVALGRTAASWPSWREEQVRDAAMLYVVAAVLARFAEDNGLVHESDDTTDVASTRGAESVLDQLTGCARVVPISHDAALDLNAHLKRRDVNGEPIHDFTDPLLDTSFLANLYQDLDESARIRYALLRTPPFVVELVLDLSLDPAIEEFELDTIQILDPVCGSGQFLLGAFDRLCRSWLQQEPSIGNEHLAQRALNAIHGVDISPGAVAITRFRLLLAAMRTAGHKTIEEAGESIRALQLEVADSLLKAEEPHPGATDPRVDPSRATGTALNRLPILTEGRYHVVVGNPPYVTVKDTKLNNLYRQSYDVCTGKYALTVPFTQRFFQLAKSVDQHGIGAGYVGQLVSNSFMKREFGRRLIEEFFADRVSLTHIIDTSGAFIPGHGTPTSVLVGRNRAHVGSDRTLGVLGRRGEPSVPDDPAMGKVWLSIVRHAQHVDQGDIWTQSLYLDQERLRTFPWTLGDSIINRVLDHLSTQPILRNRIERIGYFGNTGADDVFTAPPASFRRAGVERQLIADVLTGSEVRDWTAEPARQAFIPRDHHLALIDIYEYPGHLRRLWPHRAYLANRRNHSGNSYEEDRRAWYDWHHITGVASGHQWMIIFPWVATHNHYALVREPLVPLTSAPMMRLSADASESDHVQLLTLLNSSTACFWLKQQSNSKGQPNAGQTGGSEPWTEFYEFTAGRLGQLPVPPNTNLRHAAELDSLASRLTASNPKAIISTGTPTRTRLRKARDNWEGIRTRMIALQEESDWEVYGCYGLTSTSEGLVAPTELIPPLRPGERAFEIYLSRKVSAGETTTTWFSRHGSTPITDPPPTWPAGYQDVVLKRIAAIEADDTIRALEQPQFKRRWANTSWDALQEMAIRDWVLDRCEAPELWYENGRPRPLELGQLLSLLLADQSLIEAVEIYDPTLRADRVLAKLLAEEHVPCVAAMRYREFGMHKYAAWTEIWRLQWSEAEMEAIPRKPRLPPSPPRYSVTDFIRLAYWRHRGKTDMPNERLISYPQRSGEPLLIGWAGWSHAERAYVLNDLASRAIPYDRSGQLVPLLAALRELTAWGPHSAEANALLNNHLASSGLREKDLVDWRPPAPRRGRPHKVVPQV